MSSSTPDTISPVLREFAQRLEPILAVESRIRLARLRTGAGGTATDGLDERRRRHAQDWLVRTWLVRWVDLDDPARPGARLLEPLGPIRDDAHAGGAARAVLDLCERRGERWQQQRVNDWLSRPSSNLGLDADGRRSVAARSLAREVVGMVVRLTTGEPVGGVPMPEGVGDGWAGGQAAAWAVVPPEGWDARMPEAVRDLAGESIREAAEKLAVPAAGRAHTAWDAAWVSSGDTGVARAAAVRAAVPPAPDPGLWSYEPATPSRRRRGEDRREAAALGRAPDDARVEAVCMATIGVLHARLHPTVRALQDSAVDLFGTMVRP